MKNGCMFILARHEEWLYVYIGKACGIPPPLHKQLHPAAYISRTMQPITLGLHFTNYN
jgi:hypothetical protein